MDLKSLNDAEAVDEDVGNQVHDPDAEEEEEGAATKPLPQPKKPSARESPSTRSRVCRTVIGACTA